MSIIEKAAAKLDKKLFKDDASIIEKAAKTLEGKEETAVVEKTAPKDKSSKNLAPSTTPKSKSKRLALNFGKLRHYGIITPDDQKTTITEQFRVIKRPLLMNSL